MSKSFKDLRSMFETKSGSDRIDYNKVKADADKRDANMRLNLRAAEVASAAQALRDKAKRDQELLDVQTRQDGAMAAPSADMGFGIGIVTKRLLERGQHVPAPFRAPISFSRVDITPVAPGAAAVHGVDRKHVADVAANDARVALYLHDAEIALALHRRLNGIA
jgi:hypothetical protein